MQPNENRTQLSKYYARVKRCRLEACKRLYGVDGWSDDGICPTCQLNKEKRRK